MRVLMEEVKTISGLLRAHSGKIHDVSFFVLGDDDGEKRAEGYVPTHTGLSASNDMETKRGTTR